MTDFRLPLNKRVALRGDRTDVYTLAKAGAEGWIRAHSRDQYGYPLIQIEWDKSHWGYNGQQDTWTFEDHFDLIEETMSEPNKEDLAAAFKVLERALVGTSDEEPVEEVKPVSGSGFTPNTDKEYAGILKAATERAVEGEAFLMISIHQDGEMRVPRISISAKDEIASILLGAQISNTGMVLHQNLGVDFINLLSKNAAQDS